MSWRLFLAQSPSSSPTGSPVRTGGGPAAPFPVRVVSVGAGGGGGDISNVVLLPDGAVEVWEGEGRRRALDSVAEHRVVDLCRFLSSRDIVIVVDAEGKAFQVNWLKDEKLRPLDCLQEQSGSPSRSSGSLRASFRQCAGGEEHLVLVDRQGQAWSWGKGPQTGLVPHHKEEEEDDTLLSEDDEVVLTRIDFFQGLRVAGVTSGRDFTLALVEHVGNCPTSPAAADGGNSADGKGKPSSSSSTSSSSCPLGLPIAPNRSSFNARPALDKSVSLVEEEVVELRKKRRAEGLENGIGEDNEVERQSSVERLTQSGMYINPTDALKYLSDQLSWIGKTQQDQERLPSPSRNAEGGPPSGPAAGAQEEPAAGPTVVSNIYKATSSAMAGGVRYMGQTVSRLSQSFSVSSEKDVEEEEEEEEEGGRSKATGEQVGEAGEIPLSTLQQNLCTEASSARPVQPLLSSYSSTSSLHRRSQSASMLDKLASPKPVFPDQQKQRSESPGASATAGVGHRRRAQAKPASAKYEVWFWGRSPRGQAGQGDMLDRLQPCQVSELADRGVRKVACGPRHCLALTASGAVYGWGENAAGQACPSYLLAVCPSPTKIDLPVGETACDVAVVGSRSYVLTDCGSIFLLGGRTKDKRSSLQPFKPAGCRSHPAEEAFIPRALLSSASHLVVFDGPHDLPMCNFKAVEKLFLFKLHEIVKRVLEPLCSKGGGKQQEENMKVRRSLLSRCEDLSGLVSESVAMLSDVWLLKDCDRIPLVNNPTRFEKVFSEYSAALCDCLASGCLELDSQEFTKLSPVAVEVLSHVCHVDPSELGGELVQSVVSQPLSQLEQYLSCFRSMVAAGRKQKSLHVLKMCDLVERAAQAVKAAERTVERQRKVVEETRTFWELHGTRFLSLKHYRRRVLLDSRSVPVQVAGGGVVGRHWIVLMSDVLVHAGYSGFSSHPLQTVWIESHGGGSTAASSGTVGGGGEHGEGQERHEVVLVMPEDSLTLVALSAEAKSEWFGALQRSILEALRAEKRDDGGRLLSFTNPPITRRTRYKFQKTSELKGAEYEGTWMQGKMHGHGTITWPDGRVYKGQLRQNQKHGYGRLEAPPAKSSGVTGKDVFEGQWRSDHFEGKGRVLYANGDVYEGQLRDGRPHGQGTFKQGRFMGGGASVYVGEWVGGARQGYGVSDDIVSGEKYMGMWAGDVKSGPGCVVSLDGVYYEGTFSHGKMAGRGLMLFEDETSYEGNFADAGVFSGQGCLTYANGDRMEGAFFGNYTDGMKFNGTIYKSRSGGASNPIVSQNTDLNRNKIGKFSVEAGKKWLAIFSHYYEILCIPENAGEDESNSVQGLSPVAWEQLAILINQAKNSNATRGQAGGGPAVRQSSIGFHGSTSSFSALDGLEMIPDYHASELTRSYLEESSAYLGKAFASRLHPMHELLSMVCDCFNATYGGVRLHPRLLKHAVEELRSLTNRLYHIIRVLFPALPACGDQRWIEDSITSKDDDKSSSGDSGIGGASSSGGGGGGGSNGSTMVDASYVVFPHLLPRVHSSVFMLYALYYKREDDEYWARILKWNRHPDLALLTFLEVGQKFWQLGEEQEENGGGGGDGGGEHLRSRSLPQVRDGHFCLAIETLQHIKTKFTPFEKLSVILETFREINRIGQSACGPDFCWSMDDLFPVFQYVVVRARILQLGAEIHMVEDLVESHLLNGEYGIMFTTLQASYYQILKESLSI